MSSPQSPGFTTPSCGDSPLSTAASIVGILTFALGLLASYIAFQSATRGAPTEISRLIDDLRTTQHEINRVAEYIFDDAHHHTHARTQVSPRLFGDTKPPYVLQDTAAVAGGGDPSDAHLVLYDEVQKLLGDCVRLFYEADQLLKRCQSDSESWHPEGLRRRMVYVMNRHEVGEKMLRLGDQKAKLANVQMNLFIRKSAMQDAMLKQITDCVMEMQRQLGKRRVSSSSVSGEQAV